MLEQYPTNFVPRSIGVPGLLSGEMLGKNKDSGAIYRNHDAHFGTFGTLMD